MTDYQKEKGVLAMAGQEYRTIYEYTSGYMRCETPESQLFFFQLARQRKDFELFSSHTW